MTARDVVILLFAVVFVLVLVVVAVAWTVLQWQECRGYGFSIFYCLKHVL